MCRRLRRHTVRCMESALDSILYIETEIPPQMTHAEYRRSRAAIRRRSSLRFRVLHRVRLAH
jgi:hypothetical protein